MWLTAAIQLLQKTNAKEVFRRQREVDGYVGFANLPNQVYRKAVKKGFEFSLMVVGKSRSLCDLAYLDGLGWYWMLLQGWYILLEVCLCW